MPQPQEPDMLGIEWTCIYAHNHEDWKNPYEFNKYVLKYIIMLGNTLILVTL